MHAFDGNKPTFPAAGKSMSSDVLPDICLVPNGVAGQAGQAALAYLLACGALLDQPLLSTGTSSDRLAE